MDDSEFDDFGRRKKAVAPDELPVHCQDIHDEPAGDPYPNRVLFQNARNEHIIYIVLGLVITISPKNKHN